MESSFHNSLSDFDLNFLDHAPKKPLILNRVLKKSSVAYLKTKVLLTDSIVQKYNSSKDLLDQTQKSLLESQHECKNICIDYRNCLEKCTILEKEILNIQNENKQLQDRRFTVETQYEGLQSHINQLQVLITDYETQLESLKIEAKLHKDTILSHERKENRQKKESETLKKHVSILRDVIKKKRKLTNKKVQNVLDKYNNVKNDLDNESESEADSSSDHFEDAATTFFSEDSSDTIVISQAQETTKSIVNKFESIADEDTTIKRITSTESENNDGRSVDTGRGSSLAFSDGGKSSHSPDYYMNDSPLGSVILSSNKKPPSYQDGATSPMHTDIQYRNVSTSPIPTQKACRDRGTSPLPIKLRSVATSPVMFEKNHDYIVCNTVNRVDRGASPIMVLDCFKSKNNNVKECRDAAVDTTSLVSDTTTSRVIVPREKECLEINNSWSINEDSQSDCEIQMILGEMKLHERLITPIPSTPFKSSKARRLHTASNCNVEESLFDKLGPEGLALTKKIDAVFNMISSMKESMFNGQVDVRKQQENTGNSRKEILKNAVTTVTESSRNDSLNVNEGDLNSEHEVERNGNRDLTKNNPIVIVSQFTEENSSNINEANSDTENCVEEPQTSSLLVKSNNNSKSKTDTDNQLDQVLNQQTETIDDDDENDNLMVCFENEPGNEHQIRSPDYNDTEFSKKLKYQEEIVNNVNRTIVVPNTRKSKKLTNLEKMRMRLAPRSKIRKSVPVRKRRVRPKQLRKNTLLRKRKIRASDTSASLNDKRVYAKAVQVMTELKSKQCERKILAVVVEDCLRNPTSSVLDTILTSQTRICESAAKSTVECQNLGKSVNKTTTEMKIPAKRNTIDDIEPVEIKRKLRPRQQSKSQTLSDASNSFKINKNISELNESSVESSTFNSPDVADIINSVEIANIQIERKRRRTTSSLDSDLDSLNCSDNGEKGCKASPAKRSIVIEEQKPVPITRNQRILRSSVRQENEDKGTTTVSSQPNNACKNTSDTLLNGNYTVPIRSSPRISRWDSATTSSPETKSFNNNNKTELDVNRDKIQLERKNSSDDRESPSNGNYTVPNRSNPRISRCGTSTRTSFSDTKSMNSNDKTESDINQGKTKLDNNKDKLPALSEKENKVNKVSEEHTKETVISYSDLDIFSTEPESTEPNSTLRNVSSASVIQPKESVLCLMIEKYGTKALHRFAKKPSESITDKIHQKLEEEIEKINKLHNDEAKIAMMKLVTEIRHWDIKDFIVGFMKYLKDPNRKSELFTAIVSPPAPPSTKSEQVLLYLLAELRYHWENVDLVYDILNNVEYHLFCLNRTPDFNTIESMAHFYAVLCRYYRMISRLRLFVLDALYCIQFKAVPLIKQCLDVWMHILPLAHMGIAKTPLVTCLVYLLHFYKCEDRFNRLQDLRMILKRKYFFNINDWNETKILDMFRASIKDLRDVPVEIKMLRLALLIISKRQGPKWCLKNIINGILQPMIEKNDVTEKVKLFCISMLGPLLKPFPNDMKVHCEVVVNKLMDMLDLPHSQGMLETIYSSLIYISKHNEVRLHHYLLKWNPPKISPEFETVLRDYVKSRPIKVWKYALRNGHSSS